MSLAIRLHQQINDPQLSTIERASLRCQLAKELQDSGNYEAARDAMGELWQRIGERPKIGGLDPYMSAELLLRAGSLSGWIGSARQIEGAQEIAKDLITESAAIFESLQETERVAEARIDLAICYWREGGFDEARVTLKSVLDLLAEKDSEQKARALLNSALVESSSGRFNEALHILTVASPLFAKSQSHAAKGRFHIEIALVFRNLGRLENR